jgi:PLP dependent protein
VALVAVSKTVPPVRLQAAVAAGLSVLGENRVQELLEKAALVPGATWHLVGHLQGNKARRALEVCAAVHSLDSLELAQRLDRLVGEGVGATLRAGARFGAGGSSPMPPPLAVYLEVNVDRDRAKSGFAPEDLARGLEALAALPGLRLEGLMTVGRLSASAEAARPTFRALRTLAERLRASEPRLGPGLSMGMSDDFEVAVEEGATIVRVGRAIFGERPAR